jgi:hypothetical protein
MESPCVGGGILWRLSSAFRQKIVKASGAKNRQIVRENSRPVEVRMRGGTHAPGGLTG